ncbi:hypothetical protein FOL47_007530 [Perkinsus chesapeaki]|uniref:Carbohydrate kinase PfkB domain-containing protein n=1 Tax=Perkinsus chesapeaki TaxID=330153 RepID=A0A7J6LJQ5_PERCH|nr:hypothetical protein FOL47_007530 [Perkinsus chesapeaki]
MTRMSEQFTADEIPIKPFNDFWSTHKVSCLYLDGRFASVAEVYAREAVTRGVPVVMDVERSNRDGLIELLAMCTGIIVSGYDTIDNILQTNNKESLFDISSTLQWMVITLGEKGSVMETRGGEKVTVAARKVNDVMDTTGAGDAYQAGLVYSICKRLINKEDNG